MLEREQEFFVDLLCLFARLIEQPLTLQKRIVLLAVARRDFYAINDELENVNE